MNSFKVLDFYGYSRLLEEEVKTQELSSTGKTLNELISLFFKCYMAIASKTVDYKGVLSDLVSITSEKDPAKRADAMEKAIKNVTDKLDPKYVNLKEDATKAASTIKDLYSEIASTEEAKKETEAIDKLVNDKIVGYQDILKTQPLKESKNIHGFVRYSFPLLYEKNTFKDERSVILDKMKSLYSEMLAQQKSPSSEALKSRANEVVSKFEEYEKTLSDEDKWKDMKRKERKDTLEKMNKDVDDIVQKTNELQKSELAKIGVDKKIADSMASVISSINSIMDKAKEVDDKVISDAKSAETTEGKEGEYKVGEIVKYKKENGEEAENEIVKIEGDKITLKTKEGKEFTKEKKEITGKSDAKVGGGDIKSGNVDKANLKKDGPNYETIKKFQKDYNSLGIGEKIGEDGGYGKNTESAIKKISGMIKSLSGKEIKTDDGKLLTSDLRDSLKKLIDNKDKIKDILK